MTDNVGVSLSHLIDRATGESGSTETDWALNMQLCDTVNSNPQVTKEVLKEIQKRLKSKKPRVQILTLTLLGTLVKNCYSTNAIVGSKDFQKTMFNLATSKKTNIEVQEKVVDLIQTFAHSFRQREDLPLFEATLIQLKRKGIDLPMQANSSPVFIPPEPPKFNTRKPVPEKTNTMPPRSQGTMGELSDEHDSLNSFFLETKSNVELLQEMLRAVNPEEEKVQDNEIIQQLLGSCRGSLAHIQNLIESGGISSDAMLEKFLLLNDNIQQLLEAYENLSNGKVVFADGSRLKKDKSKTLIDFEGYSSESDSESESSFVNKPNPQVNDPFTQPVPKINAPPIRKMSNPTISPNSFNAPTLQSSFGNLTINPSPPTNSQAKNIFDDEFAAIANRNVGGNQQSTPINPFNMGSTSQPNNSQQMFGNFPPQQLYPAQQYPGQSFPVQPFPAQPLPAQPYGINVNPFLGQNTTTPMGSTVVPSSTPNNQTQSQSKQDPFEDLFKL